MPLNKKKTDNCYAMDFQRSNIYSKLIGMVGRVFANVSEEMLPFSGNQNSIRHRVILKTQKIILDTSLLNTQHYKVEIKGK